MRIRVWALPVCVAAVLTAAGAHASGASRGWWPMGGYDVADTSFARTERTLSADNVGRLRLLWRVPLPAATGAQPIVADGRVFTVDMSGTITAFRAADGRKLWSAHPGTFGVDSSSAPAVAGGRVYVGGQSNNTVFAFDAATGRIIWQSPVAPSGASINPPLRLVAGVLYVTAGDLIAIRANDGAVLWHTPLHQEEASPAYAGGVLFAPGAPADLTPDQDLYAVSAHTGQALWSSYAMLNTSGTSAAIGNGRVYIGSSGGDMNAYRAAGCGSTLCHPLWSFRKATGIVSTAAIAYDTVYFQADKLYALATQDGHLRWSANVRPANSDSPTVANGVVYVGSNTNHIYAFRALGCGQPICQPLWSATVGPLKTIPDTSTVTVAASRLYVAGNAAGLTSPGSDLSAFALKR